MLTKALLTLVLAACGVDPPEFQPPPVHPQEKDHYFCCGKLDEKGFSGDDCTEIPESHVIACNKVLYCDGKYKKDDKKVTCE